MSIKMTPFEADLGYAPKSIPDHVFGKLLGKAKDKAAAFEFGKCQKMILDRAKQNLSEAQKRMITHYNKNRPIQNFEVGDLVLISARNLDIEHLGVIADGCRKFAPLWIGPYRVKAKTTPDTYRVKLPLGLRLHDQNSTRAFSRNLWTMNHPAGSTNPTKE